MSKRPVGRPSKYNNDMQDQADEYIYRLDELKHAVPSRVGLCCFLGIHKDTSYEWGAKYPAFSDTLKKIETLQEHLALNGGITGLLNPTIVKLLLANHGYSDKVSQDHTSSDGSLAPSRIIIEAASDDDAD